MNENIRDFLEHIAENDLIFNKNYALRIEIDDGGDNSYIGFNVDIDKAVPDMNDIEQVTIKTFNIIYKMTEWLEVEREARRIRKEVDTVIGQAKILKVFSSTKSSTVAGGTVIMGTVSKKEQFKLIRGGIEVARGAIEGLQLAKSPVSSVEAGNEFGMQLECKEGIQQGDIIETFKREVK